MRWMLFSKNLQSLLQIGGLTQVRQQRKTPRQVAGQHLGRAYAGLSQTLRDMDEALKRFDFGRRVQGRQVLDPPRA